MDAQKDVKFGPLHHLFADATWFDILYAALETANSSYTSVKNLLKLWFFLKKYKVNVSQINHRRLDLVWICVVILFKYLKLPIDYFTLSKKLLSPATEFYHNH